MKKNIKTRLWAFIACIMLVLSLTTLSAAAEEAEVGEPEDSTVEEESTVETEASENIFADLFGVLEQFSSEILCALSFTGSLIIALSYKKGLLPTLKGGIGSIGSAIGSIKESSENYAKQHDELMTSFSLLLSMTKDSLVQLENIVKELADKVEDGEHAAADRENMKALMSSQIDMLYEIFMSSSLPQYQKEAISERVRVMKEVTASDGEAN